MDNEEQRDHAEEAYNRELMREADADPCSVPDVVEPTPRTAAAIAANVRRGLDRKAEELRAAGFHVLSPEDYAKEREVWAARHTGERHEFAQPLTDDVVELRSMPWAGGGS